LCMVLMTLIFLIVVAMAALTLIVAEKLEMLMPASSFSTMVVTGTAIFIGMLLLTILVVIVTIHIFTKVFDE
jgi:hypothetical protein